MKAEILGLNQIHGNVSWAHATKIQGLLIGLDDLNQGLMMNFRGAYLVYVNDPCRGASFFERQIEKLNGEQRRLVRLRIQVRTLVELAQNNPQETNSILGLFKEIAGQTGGPQMAEVARLEIAEARTVAQNWVENE